MKKISHVLSTPGTLGKGGNTQTLAAPIIYDSGRRHKLHHLDVEELHTEKIEGLAEIGSPRDDPCKVKLQGSLTATGDITAQTLSGQALSLGQGDNTVSADGTQGTITTNTLTVNKTAAFDAITAKTSTLANITSEVVKVGNPSIHTDDDFTGGIVADKVMASSVTALSIDAHERLRARSLGAHEITCCGPAKATCINVGPAGEAAAPTLTIKETGDLTTAGSITGTTFHTAQDNFAVDSTGGISSGADANIAGDMIVGGGLKAASSKFTVAAASGDVTTAGGITGTTFHTPLDKFAVSSTGSISSAADADITGNIIVGGGLKAANSNLTITASSGDVTTAGGITATTFHTPQNKFTVDNTGSISSVADADIVGDMTIGGGLKAANSKFTVAADSGNVAAGGNISITGDLQAQHATFTNGLSVTNGGIGVTGNASISGVTTTNAISCASEFAAGSIAVVTPLGNRPFTVDTSGNVKADGAFTATDATKFAVNCGTGDVVAAKVTTATGIIDNLTAKSLTAQTLSNTAGTFGVAPDGTVTASAASVAGVTVTNLIMDPSGSLSSSDGTVAISSAGGALVSKLNVSDALTVNTTGDLETSGSIRARHIGAGCIRAEQIETEHLSQEHISAFNIRSKFILAKDLQASNRVLAPQILTPAINGVPGVIANNDGSFAAAAGHFTVSPTGDVQVQGTVKADNEITKKLTFSSCQDVDDSFYVQTDGSMKANSGTFDKSLTAGTEHFKVDDNGNLDTQNATVEKDLTVKGALKLNGDIDAQNITAEQSLLVRGNTTLDGDLNASGNTNVSSLNVCNSDGVVVSADNTGRVAAQTFAIPDSAKPGSDIFQVNCTGDVTAQTFAIPDSVNPGSDIFQVTRAGDVTTHSCFATESFAIPNSSTTEPPLFGVDKAGNVAAQSFAVPDGDNSGSNLFGVDSTGVVNAQGFAVPNNAINTTTHGFAAPDIGGPNLFDVDAAGNVAAQSFAVSDSAGSGSNLFGVDSAGNVAAQSYVATQGFIVPDSTDSEPNLFEVDSKGNIVGNSLRLVKNQISTSLSKSRHLKDIENTDTVSDGELVVGDLSAAKGALTVCQQENGSAALALTGHLCVGGLPSGVTQTDGDILAHGSLVTANGNFSVTSDAANSTTTLSLTGNASVSGDASVGGSLTIIGKGTNGEVVDKMPRLRDPEVTAEDALHVKGNATIDNTLMFQDACNKSSTITLDHMGNITAGVISGVKVSTEATTADGTSGVILSATGDLIATQSITVQPNIDDDNATPSVELSADGDVTAIGTIRAKNLLVQTTPGDATPSVELSADGNVTATGTITADSLALRKVTEYSTTALTLPSSVTLTDTSTQLFASAYRITDSLAVFQLYSTGCSLPVVSGSPTTSTLTLKLLLSSPDQPTNIPDGLEADIDGVYLRTDSSIQYGSLAAFTSSNYLYLEFSWTTPCSTLTLPNITVFPILRSTHHAVPSL